MWDLVRMLKLWMLLRGNSESFLMKQKQNSVTECISGSATSAQHAAVNNLVRSILGLRAVEEKLKAWSWTRWAGMALEIWQYHPQWQQQMVSRVSRPQALHSGAGRQNSDGLNTRPLIGLCLLRCHGLIRCWEEQHLHAWEDVQLCQRGSFSGLSTCSSW